jgi:hypothetical protein
MARNPRAITRRTENEEIQIKEQHQLGLDLYKEAANAKDCH